MNSISVVIITRNEEHIITSCIQSAKSVSNDIIVVDAQSDDDTENVAIRAGAKVYSLPWQGYGFSRNLGATKAKHDWILALDADERINAELAYSIRELNLYEPNCIYSFRRKNYFNGREMRFGAMGFDTVKRIYNRRYAQWDLSPVHESLQTTRPSRKKISGCIDHFRSEHEHEYRCRVALYARLSAEKYFRQGKSAGALKRYFSPLFNSIKSYIFQLGFLDGKEGFTSAKIIAWYSWQKYFYLKHLIKQSKNAQLQYTSRAVIDSA